MPRKRDKSSRAESKTTKEYTTFRIVVVVLVVVYLIYPPGRLLLKGWG